MNRSLLSLTALAGLVALSGCAGLGYYGDHYGGGDYGDYRRAPSGDYGGRTGRTTSAYRSNVERDARHYVDELDRYLGISNREERAIRDLLIRRTYQLLDQTSYSRHGGVYPFPRRSGRAQGWWNSVDREIERILDRRYREPYAYYNRYGGTRYTEYYRHRRYDARRGWYDTRQSYNDGYRDGRRTDARQDRRAQERRADRREDRRDDQAERRQAEARRAAQQRQEAQRRQEAERRQQAQRRQEAERRQQAQRRQEAERRDTRRSTERSRTDDDRARSRRDTDRSDTDRRTERDRTDDDNSRSRRADRRRGGNDD